MLSQWLLILFLNGSETGVVTGSYPSLADCNKEGEIRIAMAHLTPALKIEQIRYACAVQKKTP